MDKNIQQGAICGRGANSKECCQGFRCIIPANDAYAFCNLIKPTCGAHGDLCGRVSNRKCCKGFYCNIAPDDSYAYCDSLADPTCGIQDDICGPGQGPIKKKCCANFICNTSRRNYHAFCDMVNETGPGPILNKS